MEFIFFLSNWTELYHACNYRNIEVIKLLMGKNYYDLKETDIFKYLKFLNNIFYFFLVFLIMFQFI